MRSILLKFNTGQYTVDVCCMTCIEIANIQSVICHNGFNVNPIRSGLFQTVNDPGGGGGGGFKSPPLRSRKLFCQSSPYHTCAYYQVF